MDEKTRPVKLQDAEFPGVSGPGERWAVGCDIVMLILFTYTWIRYDMPDMLVLILPLWLCGVYLVMFWLVPSLYVCTDTALEIRHRFRRTQAVPYDSVFNISSTSRDSRLNITSSNKVTVYYEKGPKARRTACICTPADVQQFTAELKRRCPAFQDEED